MQGPNTNRKCRTCGGTGRIWSMRSWFTADGYSASRCGICAGTGKSAFRDDPAYVAFQAKARASVKAHA